MAPSPAIALFVTPTRSPSDAAEGDGLAGKVEVIGDVPGAPQPERVRVGIAPRGRRAPPNGTAPRHRGQRADDGLHLGERQGDRRRADGGEVAGEVVLLAGHGPPPRTPCAPRSAPIGSANQAAIGTTKQGRPTTASRRARSCSAIAAVWFMW